MIDLSERKFDPTKIRETKLYKYERQTMVCRFSPCGKFVFAGAFDGSVQRWNLETDQRTAFQAHSGWLEDIVMHPDGKRMFTVDSWGKLCCWEYAQSQPKPLWSIDQAHPVWIRQIDASADGKWIATGGNDTLVKIWSAADGKLVHELAGHERHVYSVKFHPDSKSLVSGDLLGKVKHWNVADGKLVRELDAGKLFHHPADRIIDAGGVRNMTFHPDGTKLVCSGISELHGSTVAGKPAALLLDWTSGKELRELRPKNHESVYGVKGIIIEGLSFHKEGFLVGVGGNGERAGAMWFWKLDSQDPFFELNEIPGSREVDIHPDGFRMAVAQFEPNGRGINGGNGLHSKKEDYNSHFGVVRIFEMAAKPATVGDLLDESPADKVKES